MLERLRSAGNQPVTLDPLRASGIDFPAVVIGELELNGYVIKRLLGEIRQLDRWTRQGATCGAATNERRRSHPPTRANPLPRGS
jgi:hypothetical protein